MLHKIHVALCPSSFFRSGTDNVTVHAQVCGLFCVLFMILCGFIQAEAVKLVLLLIVHPTLHCRHHCFFSDVFRFS